MNQEKIGKFTFRTDTKYTASLQEREKGKNRLSIRIMIDFGEKIVPEPVILRWTYPCKMIFSQWNPQLWSARTLNPQWNPIRNHSAANAFITGWNQYNNDFRRRYTDADGIGNGSG